MVDDTLLVYLAYVDDTVLTTQSSILRRFEEVFNRKGLRTSSKKLNCRMLDLVLRLQSLWVERVAEVSDRFTRLRCKMDTLGYSDPEFRRCTGMAFSTMGILHNGATCTLCVALHAVIPRDNAAHIYTTCVISVLLSGSEEWIVTKNIMLCVMLCYVMFVMLCYVNR